MTFISSTDKLKLLSSSGQGDASSCQSLLCKPQNTDWPLTPSKGVRSLLLTPLHNGDTKVQFRPPCCFFFYLSLKACIFESSYLFSTVTFMIIYITQLPEKCPMNGKAFCLRRPDKIHWQLYNQSLLPPCGHFIEAHRNWVGLASVREHWNMCIKINLSTTLALSGVYLGYSTI